MNKNQIIRQIATDVHNGEVESVGLNIHDGEEQVILHFEKGYNVYVNARGETHVSIMGDWPDVPFKDLRKEALQNRMRAAKEHADHARSIENYYQQQLDGCN